MRGRERVGGPELSDETLKKIVRELVAKTRNFVTID